MQVEKNSVVSFHYRLCKVDEAGNQGDWMESSFEGDPVYCLIGHNNIIPGLEAAMMDKSVGDEFTTTVLPGQGYGERKEGAIQRVPIKHLHGVNKKKKLLPGMVVTVQTDQGARSMMVVKAGKFNVDVDINHPLAGATLFYEIKIDSIREASAEEIAHKHVHGPGGHHH